MVADPGNTPSNDTSKLIGIQGRLTYLLGCGEEANHLNQYAKRLNQRWKDLRTKIDSMPDDSQSDQSAYCRRDPDIVCTDARCCNKRNAKNA